MKSQIFTLLVFVLFAFGMAACAPQGEATPDNGAPYPAGNPDPTDEPEAESPYPVDEDNADLNKVEMVAASSVSETLLQSVIDLGRGRSGASAATVRVLKAEPVVWPDGGLGCPAEGMMYTQVMVEGYQIVLEIEGQIYDYRGGGNAEPRQCSDANYMFQP